MKLAEIENRIIACERCPRLRSYCRTVAQDKKKEFRDWAYWGKPVPGFGDSTARIWILGLAPAAHGANRTGRMFTGDSSGLWLYRALHRYGFANQELSASRSDGLILKDVFVSSAVRCAPPDNKPNRQEIERCAPFLDEEYTRLPNVRFLLALGAIGFDATLKLLVRAGMTLPRPVPKFSHGAYYEVGKFGVLASYHPSRQNTNTGRLTLSMWHDVFSELRDRVGALPWDKFKKSSRE